MGRHAVALQDAQNYIARISVWDARNHHARAFSGQVGVLLIFCDLIQNPNPTPCHKVNEKGLCRPAAPSARSSRLLVQQGECHCEGLDVDEPEWRDPVRFGHVAGVEGVSALEH